MIFGFSLTYKSVNVNRHCTVSPLLEGSVGEVVDVRVPTVRDKGGLQDGLTLRPNDCARK